MMYTASVMTSWDICDKPSVSPIKRQAQTKPPTKAAPAKTGVTSVKEGSLRMDVTAKTFRYLDEEEIAQQKKAAQAAAAKKGAKK